MRDQRTIHEIKEIRKILKNHELRLIKLEEKKGKTKQVQATWFAPGSTIEKIVSLISQGFFRLPKKIADIQLELQNSDYHLTSSDLTLPLRKVVRKGLLKRGKIEANGSSSKVWLYTSIKREK